MPSPVADVLGYKYYVDAQLSVADPELFAKNEASLRPVRDFLAGVTSLADAAVNGDADAGARALAWLQAWSQADAMGGEINQQGGYEKEWTLGGLALAYLKVRDAGIAAGAEASSIEPWFVRMARSVQPAYDDPQARHHRNNHAHWVGVAVAASAVAAGDHELFRWGAAKFDVGAEQITAEGTLPLEMERGKRALHYHLFALTPLVFLAEIGAANGVDLYGSRGGALHRLARRCVEGLRDPSWFARRTGEEQDITPTSTLRMDEIVWAEPYQARFSDLPLGEWLHRFRPMIYPRLGGDMTMLYAN
jgi:poly(beta-D-mannuronate) lyase